MTKKAVFISAPIYKAEAFGSNHPLSYTRQDSVLKLCHYLNWIEPIDIAISEVAPLDVLSLFHDPLYIKAFQSASHFGRASIESRKKYNIGTMENPIFKGVFERAATTVGGSILSAQIALEGNIAYHPAGGTHHGQPGKASGFCYFNDPVFAIFTFLNAGLSNILYLDLDAHFGDGVANAFIADERVTCISIHEENRWPYSGLFEDSDHKNLYLAVPPHLNDCEFNMICQKIFKDKIENLAPEAVVIVAGADCLAGDPLSSMGLHNVTLWQYIEGLAQSVPHAVVLGGGGYNPWVTVRYWAGLWAKLSGKSIPSVLPDEAIEFFKGFDSDLVDEEDRPEKWFNTILDEVTPSPCRFEIFDLIDQADTLFAELS